MSESPQVRLHRLIAEFRAGSLDTESFCLQFEHTYNMELDKRALTAGEAEAFAALFEQVILVLTISGRAGEDPELPQ